MHQSRYIRSYFMQHGPHLSRRRSNYGLGQWRAPTYIYTHVQSSPHQISSTLKLQLHTMVSSSLKLATHFFAYSGLFGMTCYQSFYAGITAYRAIPLDMFGKLQHKIFPGYFAIQSALSALLLISTPFKLTTAAKASLGASLIGALVNLIVIMPKTHTIIVAREAQMEKEGKGYKDPTASDDMKALNKKFAKLHGISMLFNLGLLLGTFYYGYYFNSKLIVA